MQMAMQNLKLGGLGANIGSEEWERAKKKQEFFQEYGKHIRMQNLNKQVNTKKREEPIQKELSKRERALEFASRVPKPKVKPQAPQSQGGQGQQDNNGSQLNFSGDEFLDNQDYGDGIGLEEDEHMLQELDQKHQQY